MATAVKMESSSRQDDLVSRCINALPEVKKVVAGGIAGCVSKTFVAPLSRVTLLMQVQSMRPHKFADGRNPNNQYLVASLRKIYLEEGLTGFWRGNLATCFHRFPYTSITFYANAAIRETLQQNASTLPDQSRHLLAGGGAACAAVCTLHPLDVIKTRLMAQTRREYYTGVLDCVQKICRDEGPRGLYRGISVSLCSTTPSIAISFTAFDEFKRLFATTVLGPDEPDNFRLTLCSGACAGSLASTVMFPMDLVRRQMQMVGVGGRPLVYANVGQAIYHVFQTSFRRNRGTALGYLLGLREFFRGLAPELLKVAPHNAIMFSTQHHLISRKWLFEELLYPD